MYNSERLLKQKEGIKLLLGGLTILGERALQPHRPSVHECKREKKKGDLDIVESLFKFSTSLSAKKMDFSLVLW